MAKESELFGHCDANDLPVMGTLTEHEETLSSERHLTANFDTERTGKNNELTRVRVLCADKIWLKDNLGSKLCCYMTLEFA